MKKGLIFIGDAETSKSRTAQEFRKYFGESAAYLNGRQFKPSSKFFFSGCTKETKVLIIDELISAKYIEHFMQIVTGKLLVDKQHKMPFEIEIEQLIIICDSEIKKEDLPQYPSFQRRFTIVEFPTVSPDFLVKEIVGEVEENESGKYFLLERLSFLDTVSKTDH